MTLQEYLTGLEGLRCDEQWEHDGRFRFCDGWSGELCASCRSRLAAFTVLLEVAKGAERWASGLIAQDSRGGQHTFPRPLPTLVQEARHLLDALSSHIPQPDAESNDDR